MNTYRFCLTLRHFVARCKIGTATLTYFFNTDYDSTGEWDPEKITVDEIFQATLVVLELAILEPRAQIMGGICIFDLGELTVNQAWYMTPSVAKKMIQIMVVSNFFSLLTSQISIHLKYR